MTTTATINLKLLAIGLIFLAVCVGFVMHQSAVDQRDAAANADWMQRARQRNSDERGMRRRPVESSMRQIIFEDLRPNWDEGSRSWPTHDEREEKMFTRKIMLATVAALLLVCSPATAQIEVTHPSFLEAAVFVMTGRDGSPNDPAPKLVHEDDGDISVGANRYSIIPDQPTKIKVMRGDNGTMETFDFNNFSGPNAANLDQVLMATEQPLSKSRSSMAWVVTVRVRSTVLPPVNRCI